LRLRPYFGYKFLNSLFTGLALGSIFVVYQPLQPSIYSVGGVVLALGTMVIARFYHKLMGPIPYFRIALLVELVILLVILLFLAIPYHYTSALLVYSGYQLTFIFGSYLVRAETVLLKRPLLLSRLDIIKQAGYLAGLLLGFLFYTFLPGSKEEQVYWLHYLLVAVEVGIIWLLVRSFKRR